MIAETSAPFTSSIFTGWPIEGNGSEEDIKLNWLKQLFSSKMKSTVPELKAISWVRYSLNLTLSFPLSLFFFFLYPAHCHFLHSWMLINVFISPPLSSSDPMCDLFYFICFISCIIQFEVFKHETPP